MLTAIRAPVRPGRLPPPSEHPDRANPGAAALDGRPRPHRDALRYGSRQATCTVNTRAAATPLDPRAVAPVGVPADVVTKRTKTVLRSSAAPPFQLVPMPTACSPARQRAFAMPVTTREGRAAGDRDGSGAHDVAAQGARADLAGSDLVVRHRTCPDLRARHREVDDLADRHGAVTQPAVAHGTGGDRAVGHRADPQVAGLDRVVEDLGGADRAGRHRTLGHRVGAEVVGLDGAVGQLGGVHRAIAKLRAPRLVPTLPLGREVAA